MNLTAEGVRQRSAVLTGDMRAMPFREASFDLVVSRLAIHNLDQLRGRRRERLKAIDEAARTLKPAAGSCFLV